MMVDFRVELSKRYWSITFLKYRIKYKSANEYYNDLFIIQVI